MKTDNDVLYEYTLAIARFNNLNILKSTNNLYDDGVDEILSILTYYEGQFRALGISIKYLKFQLDTKKQIHEPPEG